MLIALHPTFPDTVRLPPELLDLSNTTDPIK